MKHLRKNNNGFVICILILFFYIIRFACSNFMEDAFLMYLIPTFWLSLFIYLKSNNHFESRLNIKKTRESFLFLIITIAIYFLANFLLGLFLKYGKNPYHSEVIINLWKYIFYIFFEEYVRFILIRANVKKMFNVACIMILFMFVDIVPRSFFNYLKNGEISDYIIYVLMVVILENILISYFDKLYDSGYILAWTYKISLGLYTYLVPLYPLLKKDSALLLKILLIFVIFFKCENISENKKTSTSEQDIKKESDKGLYVLALSIFIALTIFISGVTTCFPLAITSNSMHGDIEIGDIAIVKRINREYAISYLKVGDVIVYKLNNALIVHRILKISKLLTNNEPYYITKGDNNKKADKEKVLINQIVGITRYKLPYLGYPTIIAKKIFFS